MRQASRNAELERVGMAASARRNNKPDDLTVEALRLLLLHLKMADTVSPTHPDVPPFPAPSTFSILPDIYLLLSRIDILQQSPPGQTQSSAVVSATVVAQQPPISHPHATSPGNTAGAQATVTIKELASLVHPIRQKIAKAKAAVTTLPDVDRSVEEQRRDISTLEARVRALSERLSMLSRIAGQGKSEDQKKDMVMGGIKD